MSSAAAPLAADAGAERPRRTRRLAVALGGILLLGLGVRLVGLTTRGLWLDEVVSVEVASHRVSAIVTGQVFDNHTPPLYYLLLHPWLRLVPESALTVRLPSVLADLVCLALLSLVTWRAFGRRAGTAVAAAWAVAPFAVRLAQEARMYSLLMLLVVSSFALALEVDRRRDRLWPAVAAAAVATAALYTHYYAALPLLVLHVAMAWHLRGDRVACRRWWLAMGGAALAFLPWLPVVARLITGGGQTFRVFRLAVLPYSVLRFAVGFSILPTTWTGKQNLGATVLDHLPLLLVVGLGAGAALLLGLRAAWRPSPMIDGGYRPELAGRLVVVLAAGPPLLALAVGMMVPSLDERYLAVSFPFVLVLGVLGIVAPGGRRWRPVQMLAVGIFVAGAVAQVAAPDAGTTPWREAGAALRRAEPGGATIVVRPGFYVPVLRRQLPGPRWEVVAELPGERPQRPDGTDVRPSGGAGATRGRAVSSGRSLWLVEVAFLTRDSPFRDPRWTARERAVLDAGNGLRLSRLDPVGNPAEGSASHGR